MKVLAAIARRRFKQKHAQTKRTWVAKWQNLQTKSNSNSAKIRMAMIPAYLTLITRRGL